MSRRKQSKSDLDDLDDVLGDLLGDDDPPKKTPAKGRAAASGAGKKTPGVFDDAFYASLAAEANSESDMSDANPDDIAKSLAGLDDMDSALFGGGSGGQRSSTPKSPASRENAAPSASTTTSKGPSKKPTKPSDIDFDEDDPLAGLLSDEEDTKPKVTSRPSRSPARREEPKPEETKPVTPAAEEKDDDSSSQNSRRLEIERPPTRSGNQDRKERKSRHDDINFDDDDDDVLGGMGLESPGRQRPAAAAAKKEPEEDSSSFLASLGIGKSSDGGKPGSGSRRPETFFDRMEKKAATGKQPAKEPKEEEIAFGSYMPSAASGGGGGSRPSSHRSVRFEDDEERPTSRHSTPGGRRGGSYLDDILDKDDTNWLDMASSSNPARPSSEGSTRKETEQRKPKTTSTSSAPVDWLGLSRLGSPDNKLSADVPGEGASDRPLKSSLRTPPAKEDRQTKPQPKNDNLADDWLGLGDSVMSDKEDDWLSAARTPAPRETRTSARSGTDTAQAKQEPKPSRVTRQDSHSDDWLGLGSDKEDDAKNDSTISAFSDNQLDVSIPRAGRRATRTPPSNTVEKTHQSSQPADDDLDGLSATLQALKSERATKSTPAESFQPTVSPAVPTPQPNISLSVPLVTAPPQPQLPQLPQTNVFQQQQTLIAQQQEMQQKQMQQQVESQMVRMRQQQEDQMKMLQAQQEQMMQRMSNPMMDFQNKMLQQQQQMMQQQMMKQQMPMPSFGMGFGLPGMDDLEGKVKRLEFEKQHMDLMSENMKKQHEQEVKLVETSYQKQIQLLEETFGKRETRLREENELLSQQLVRRQDEWDKAKQDEIRQLKELHREEINKLRSEHEQGLGQLKKAKDLEIDAIATSQSHAKSLQLVMEQISANARDLSDLHKAVEVHSHSSLEERETSVKTRDQQLKTLQDRLERQHHDNEVERARLQGLITKLEHQLTEQTRVNEEDRWSLAQEKNRLNSLQTSLERERMSIQEQLKRERLELQKSRESLLEEQRSILGQLHDERRILAEERAHFQINQKLKQDKEQRDSLYQVKNEAELESGIKLLGDEKQRISTLTNEIQQQNEKLQAEKAKLEQEKRSVEMEWTKLQQANVQVNQRSRDIEEWVNEACRAKEEGSAALSKAQQLEREQMQRLQAVQAQLQALRDKEKTIAQERLSLAREKKNLEQSWNTVLCASCRTPIKDTGPSEPANTITSLGSNALQMSKAATNLYNSLDPELRSRVITVSDVAKSIEADRSVRQWRMAADKDKEFLKEESMFLEALRYTPFH